MGKSKEKWLKTGLEILEQNGIEGLTIDQMSRRLRLTKGSFYHHFANMAEFEKALIAYWADQQLAPAVRVPADPATALALLDTTMFDVIGPDANRAVAVAIRAWAQQDERVRIYVEEVDANRHDFMFQIFLSLTGDVIRARRMADIFFTMLIGSSMALPRYSSERFSILYSEFKRLYELKTG